MITVITDNKRVESLVILMDGNCKGEIKLNIKMEKGDLAKGIESLTKNRSTEIKNIMKTGIW